MPCFILLTPERVIYDLLNYWVDIHGVGKLDSSFCSSTSRHQFLSLLDSDKLSFETSNLQTFNYIDWLIIRQIRVRELLCEKNENQRNIC